MGKRGEVFVFVFAACIIDHRVSALRACVLVRTEKMVWDLVISAFAHWKRHSMVDEIMSPTIRCPIIKQIEFCGIYVPQKT